MLRKIEAVDATMASPALRPHVSSVFDVMHHTGPILAADAAERRARWRTLVGVDLPAAAVDRPDWPIRLDHCFARVVLDAVHGRPWRESIAAPAWRHMTLASLADAIALGEAILAGTADLHALNARSLAMRGRR